MIIVIAIVILAVITIIYTTSAFKTTTNNRPRLSRRRTAATARWACAGPRAGAAGAGRRRCERGTSAGISINSITNNDLANNNSMTITYHCYYYHYQPVWKRWTSALWASHFGHLA